MQVQSTYAFNVDIDPIAVWRSFTGVVRVNVVCAEWVALLPDVVDALDVNTERTGFNQALNVLFSTQILLNLHLLV